MSEILQVEGIRKTYHNGRTDVHVLRGISLSVREGEIGVVMGPSGSGKSTLLHVLGLLDTLDEGKIVYRGNDVSNFSEHDRDHLRNAELGFIFQFFHLLPDLNMLENVILPGMIGHGVSWTGEAKERWLLRAEELLDRVGLGKRLKHFPAELSGGERQRVAIARALINQPKIVFCDEPTGNLDSTTSKSIRSLIWDLNMEQNTTFVIVTHNPDFAENAHWTARLLDGQIGEFART